MTTNNSPRRSPCWPARSTPPITACHVEGLVRRYRKVQKQDDAAVERQQGKERQLVYYQDDDGMWI